MALAQPFDLDLFDDGAHITRVIETLFDGAVTSFTRLGQGFYARIYRVSIDKDPHTVIVKCHKYAGRSGKEKAQLEALRSHALAKVPQVYALHLPSNGFPGEALTMEYIPGVNASEIEFPDERLRRRFVDQVVENLLAWHAVENPLGFGELDGPLYRTWSECFRARVASYHARIHSAALSPAVSEYVMSVIDRSFESTERIFEGASQRSSLVHSDYNAWNMMLDPVTFELTGIIDPIDAGWSDCEIDLFHLANCRPDFGLLERYLQEIPVDERFWLRYRFYRFWDDVKHYVRMGWYEERRFRDYASELEAAMEACLR